MAENAVIYTGLWTNWERGKIAGVTITLPSRDATILTSFVTALLAFTGTQLWKILVYIIHQTRYSEDHVDGLEHQQRVLLRNSSDAGPAAWALILHWWSWRDARQKWKTARRTLVPLVLTIFFLVAITLLSVLVPATLQVYGDRLLRHGQCGYNVAESGYYNDVMLFRNQRASTYSQDCYENFDPRACLPYPVLETYLEKNVSCPFGSICSYRNGSVPFTLSTGLLDSRAHLGINRPESIQYRQVRTCSLINHAQGTINATSNGTSCQGSYTYFVGTWFGLNYTFTTDICASLFGTLYTVSTRVTCPGCELDWKPIPALNRSDAMVTLVLVAANGVLALEPIDDPMFSFHVLHYGGTYNGKPTIRYKPDKPGTMMACADQYQMCNPYNKRCSELKDGYNAFRPETLDTIGFSVLQQGIAIRVAEAAAATTLEETLVSRWSSALRASQLLAERYQMPLLRDQYILEAKSWFTTALVSAQMKIVEFASGGPNNTLPTLIENTTAEFVKIQNDMCPNQLTPITGDTLSYSFLSLLLVICLCLLIVIISFSLEPCVKSLSRRYFPRSKTANKTTVLWMVDDVFQLQRLMFEALGLMNWTNDTVLPVPLYKEKQFGSLDRLVRSPRFSRAANETDTLFTHQAEETAMVDTVLTPPAEKRTKVTESDSRSVVSALSSDNSYRRF